MAEDERYRRLDRHSPPPRSPSSGVDEPIVTTEQAHQALLDAGLTPAEADAVTTDYGDAQLNALKTSMLAVAFLAILSLWFTRRLPGRREETA